MDPLNYYHGNHHRAGQIREYIDAVNWIDIMLAEAKQAEQVILAEFGPDGEQPDELGD